MVRSWVYLFILNLEPPRIRNRQQSAADESGSVEDVSPALFTLERRLADSKIEKGGQDVEIAFRALRLKSDNSFLENSMVALRAPPPPMSLAKAVAFLLGWRGYQKNTLETQIWQVTSLLLEVYLRSSCHYLGPWTDRRLASTRARR